MLKMSRLRLNVDSIANVCCKISYVYYESIRSEANVLLYYHLSSQSTHYTNDTSRQSIH